jgi:hypothetical protein
VKFWSTGIQQITLLLVWHPTGTVIPLLWESVRLRSKLEERRQPILLPAYTAPQGAWWCGNLTVFWVLVLEIGCRSRQEASFLPSWVTCSSGFSCPRKRNMGITLLR